jgi:hypothetical protein
MNTTLIGVRNPKWHTPRKANGEAHVQEDGSNFRVIDCETQWSHLGDNTQEWQPFTANPNDAEQHGKDLYAALVNGDHGAITDE